jgi:hypothetical protein
MIHVKEYDACFDVTIVGAGRSCMWYCQRLSCLNRQSDGFLMYLTSIKKDDGFVKLIAMTANRSSLTVVTDQSD